MRKLVILISVIAILSLPVLVWAGEESMEVLNIKKEMLQERILRIQSQLELLKVQFRDGQQTLKMAQDELDEINKKLEAVRSKPVEPKK